MNVVPFILICTHFSYVHRVVMVAGLGQAREPTRHAAEVVCAR